MAKFKIVGQQDPDPTPDQNQSSSPDSESQSIPELCAACFGSGFEVVAGHGARRCPVCRPAIAPAAKHLALMPRLYRNVTLAGLVPQDDIHPMQKEIIPYMQAHPGQNYYLCGKNDTGKTMFLWALYEHAATSGRNVLAMTLNEWIEQNIAAFKESMESPSGVFSLDELHHNDREYSVFLDDIDKKKPTEYVADMLFQLVDSVYRYKHQLVVTSQLDPEREIDGRVSLIEHFEKGDPRYGMGIVRRIVNNETAVWKMF